MKFNDDLLLGLNDREIATQAYPNFYYALDFPELRAFFQPYDKQANEAKKSSRRSGLIAIALGLGGWFLAVAEPAYENLEFGKKIILLLSALLGVLSVVIGIRGILFSSAKHKWLLNRFITERLRQFFFQNIVFHLRETCLGMNDAAARAEFKRQSLARFEAFKKSLSEKTASEFDRIVKGSDDNAYWAMSPNQHAFDELDITKHSEAFSAYYDLRINHQLDYAWYKLRKPRYLSDFPAKMLEKLFSGISLSAIAFLFLLNFGQIVAIIAGFKIINEPWSYIVSIWIAIIPLAIRTLEEGLQPQREVERYENYKNTCHLKSEQFNSAVSAEEKCALMVEMERASIDEMRLFLKTHLSARFVM